MELCPDLFSDVITDLEDKGASVVVQADPGVTPVDYKIEATWPNGDKWLVEEIRIKGGKLMDANDLIDVRYRGAVADGASSIVIHLEIDDLESPQEAINLLDTRFHLNEKVSMWDILAVWWYIRAQNEKRKKAKEG